MNKISAPACLSMLFLAAMAVPVLAQKELVDSSVDGLLIPDLTGPIILLTIMTITVPIVLLRRRKY